MSFKTAALAVAGWLFFAAIAGITLLPHLPSSWLQWLLLVLLGPPVYVVLEGLGAWIFSPAPGEPQLAKPISLRRIGLVVLSLVVAAALAGAIYANW